MRRTRSRPRRSRHTLTEYFLAAVGLALLLFLAALLLTADACRIQPSPELGLQPANRPLVTPSPVP